MHLGAITFLISKAAQTVFGTKALTQVIKEESSVKKGTASPYNYFGPLGV